jgi:hypothetical protein
MSATLLQFPSAKASEPATASVLVDAILRTNLAKVSYRGELHILAKGAKQIRDLFRELGWSRYFRVTKGCWTLGPKIEWAKGYDPAWLCERQMAERERRRTSNVWFEIGCCDCETCKYREAQKRAVGRRINYVLNKAFHQPGTRTVGDHSDAMTDYFDSDYTFYP